MNNLTTCNCICMFHTLCAFHMLNYLCKISWCRYFKMISRSLDRRSSGCQSVCSQSDIRLMLMECNVEYESKLSMYQASQQVAACRRSVSRNTLDGIVTCFASLSCVSSLYSGASVCLSVVHGRVQWWPRRVTRVSSVCHMCVVSTCHCSLSLLTDVTWFHAAVIPSTSPAQSAHFTSVYIHFSAFDVDSILRNVVSTVVFMKFWN